MKVSFIAAVARNRVIGREGSLPWHLPADLRIFKRVTHGKPVVMGRRTWDSLGRPLPGRLNIVLTRNPHFRAEGCRVAHTPEEALAAAGDAEEVMICGGAAVYAAFLPLAERIYLTEVHADLEGDTFFPSLDAAEWEETRREEHGADERHAHAFTFRVLERVRQVPGSIRQRPRR